MDRSDPVKLFIAHSQLLADMLHGEALSDLDLHRLVTQLHLLEQKLNNLQTLRQLVRSKPAA
jgi:hypothetical protein